MSFGDSKVKGLVGLGDIDMRRSSETSALSACRTSDFSSEIVVLGETPASPIVTLWVLSRIWCTLGCGLGGYSIRLVKDITGVSVIPYHGLFKCWMKH
jgi:hypothetical protein